MQEWIKIYLSANFAFKNPKFYKGTLTVNNNL